MTDDIQSNGEDKMGNCPEEGTPNGGQDNRQLKSGFATLIGRPNVGKSTLMSLARRYPALGRIFGRHFMPYGEKTISGEGCAGNMRDSRREDRKSVV